MSELTREEVLEALGTVKYPGYQRDIVSFGLVKNVTLSDDVIAVTLTTRNSPEEKRNTIRNDVIRVCKPFAKGKIIVEEEETQRVPLKKPLPDLRPANLKRIVVVGSGKGGVGKSTVAANLAVSLAKEGARTGVLDADIYGPNIPRMFGLEGLLQREKGRIRPLEKHGIKIVSGAFLMQSEQAAIWRGPMLQKAMAGFLRDVEWGELDYLIVDLPPGTGDVPLSLAQYARPDGAVVVTTPSIVACDDARRAVTMFGKLDIPVWGIIENMASYRCPDCHSVHRIFGDGEELSRFGIPVLGTIPLDPSIRKGGDEGTPVSAGGNEVLKKTFGEIAGNIAAVAVEEKPVRQERKEVVA